MSNWRAATKKIIRDDEIQVENQDQTLSQANGI